MKYLSAVLFAFAVATITHVGGAQNLHTTKALVILGANATTTTEQTTTTLPEPQPLPVTAEEAKWDTRSTDPTAYWPTTASPIASLPLNAQTTFACIRYVESRNHLTSVSYSGAGGLYQFMPLIWSAYGGLKYAPTPELATGNQQDQVAVNVFERNHGFYPEWQDPACD